ncbi:uncharacterized protein TNCV_592191 [Trichonephila clavipes]|nr:uncharacterized protein TNCV_592191 [Trichonephila clavipes]
MEGEERWEAPDHSQGFLSLNWGGTEQKRTVTYMVLKANDRRKTLALSRDEFRGPRPDSVRQDDVEKLAYQLNEESERTERPIRRLSKVMYGSTCADMQVDVMGECLSSIKHVVGVRSVFLAKRLHAV